MEKRKDYSRMSHVIISAAAAVNSSGNLCATKRMNYLFCHIQHYNNASSGTFSCSIGFNNLEICFQCVDSLKN